jgi:hypothetical protein
MNVFRFDIAGLWRFGAWLFVDRQSTRCSLGGVASAGSVDLNNLIEALAHLRERSARQNAERVRSTFAQALPTLGPDALRRRRMLAAVSLRIVGGDASFERERRSIDWRDHDTIVFDANGDALIDMQVCLPCYRSRQPNGQTATPLGDT